MFNSLSSVLGLSVFACTAVAVPLELTTNGNFETGTTIGYEYFPAPSSTFTVGNAFASTGLFGAEILNDGPPSAAVVKQANIGQGIVVPNEQVNISFDARGETRAGGVVFAEFFSELDGGGTSSNIILGGGPLSLTSAFQTFMFTTPTGSNVDGGVTLQFAVATGGDQGSFSRFEVDNVSVTVDRVPEPASLALLGLGGAALLARRRPVA